MCSQTQSKCLYLTHATLHTAPLAFPYKSSHIMQQPCHPFFFPFFHPMRYIISTHGSRAISFQQDGDRSLHTSFTPRKISQFANFSITSSNVSTKLKFNFTFSWAISLKYNLSLCVDPLFLFSRNNVACWWHGWKTVRLLCLLEVGLSQFG